MKAMTEKKKFRVTRVSVLILTIVFGVVLMTGIAWSAVIYSDDLGSVNPERGVRGGEIVDTSFGRGWRSTQQYRPLPGRAGFSGSDSVLYRTGKSAIPDDRGMLELLIVNHPEGKKDGADTVFEFLSTAERKGLWQILVDWDYPGGPLLQFDGDDYRNAQFTNRLVLPSVPEGGLLHLALSWDDKTMVRNVTANGLTVPFLLPLENVNRDPHGKSILKKQRKEKIGGLLAKADSLRLGILGFYERYWPDGEQPANDTVVLAFALHDDPNDEPVLLGPREPQYPESGIVSLDHDAVRVAGFSGKLVAGDELTVSMEEATGGVASFDIARLADDDGNIALDWKGWGVYLDEDKVFFEDDEVDLEEVEEYRVYVSKEPFSEVTLETETLETLEVNEQSYVIEDLEWDVPYYAAVVAVMDDDSIKPIIMPRVGIPMVEDTEVQAGLYQGQYEVVYGDQYPEAVVIGYFSRGGVESSQRAEDEFEIDASLNIDVAVSVEELKADEESTSKVTVTVTDANGDAVSDHEIKFLLATTSQYTGVIGGGQFFDEVGGTLRQDFWGETDIFGQVTATYTAGFAAKTAVIVARDMVSNDTGAGYIKTYIQAAAELELEAVQEVAGKALGYDIAVTSSDEWLTADGDSEARITALVTKDGDPVEGHDVVFDVTSGTGSIRTVNGTTDGNGRARAVYTAGKKIGMVLITAVDTTVGIRGSVQIELRSDAPAKISIEIDPDRLPADGHSKADLLVLVTDINDNPNEGVEVEYQVVIGSGRLRDKDKITDKDGESRATYVAGRIPGKVAIEVTVRSTVPTEEELRKARDLALTVPDYDFF